MNLETQIIVQAHRGGTGYYPENSIQGFLYVLKKGISYIELDVVVSGDGQLIVSHDPLFRNDISINIDGSEIALSEEKNTNIFQLKTKELTRYKCVNDPKFANQFVHSHFKPTLLEVINEIKEFCKKEEIKLPTITIEPKSREEWIPLFQPSVEIYANIINDFHLLYLSEFNIIYHSFDKDLLFQLSKFNNLELDLLIDNFDSLQEELQSLNFKPRGLGINYKFITQEIINYLIENEIKLSVWTVNELNSIIKLIKIGVENIISDYPFEVIEIIDKLK